MASLEMCVCGQLLHYRNPDIERYVRKMVRECGPTVLITTSQGTWQVPRHYIALHGLRTQLAARFGFEKVTTKASLEHADGNA